MKPDKYIKNYIDGALQPSDSGEYLDNYNPATGKVYAHLADSATADVQKAVEAAERAFPEWSNCGTRVRYRILSRLADIIEQNLEAFARAESIDTGKPFTMARSVDIPRAQANIRFFATSIIHFASEAHYSENESINFTLRQPLGVVACISPWNLPLYLFTWKIAPALAVGNCVIAKPSELAPMTAYMLGKAAIEAGLPNGVLNILHGSGSKVGQAMIEHPKIQAISFTGGTATGREIARIAAPMFKKLSLKLSGKNANIIFDDCDFDKAILGTLRSSFSNNGQLSLSGSRIFVQAAMYEKFKDDFVKRTQFLKIGDPFSPVTDLGALISLEHMEKILSYIALAEVEGGKILCGGDPIPMKGQYESGYFIRPAIIEGLSPNSRVNQEEIFGPVVTIMPFETETEVIEFANATEYGLAASIWTKDISKATRVVEKLKVGVAWINDWNNRDLRTPFGGLGKSGIGREGGMEALRFFTNAKNVGIKY